MALSYDTISIAGVSTDVLTLAGTGDTREFILKDVLTTEDVAVLDDINTNGTGATLKAKMEAWDLSNGRKAFDVYESSVLVFAAYDTAMRNAYAGRIPASQVAIQTEKLEQIQAVIDGDGTDDEKVTDITAILA